MQIRTAQSQDTDLIAPLFDAYRQFYEQASDLSLATRFIRERLEKRESEILLAVDAADPGKLLGFCQLYPTFCSVEAEPIYTLYDLFVIPEARRLGAGKELLEAARLHAAAQGKRRMDLTTARTNTRAQALYESMGWVRDDVFLAYNRRVDGEPRHARP